MKILVILSRVPYPLEKGDKLRAFNQIKQLSKKHEIILFALNDTIANPQAVDELKKYCSAISIIKFSKFTILLNLIRTLFDGKPFQVGYFYFSAAQKKVDELIKKHDPDHIYCQLIRTVEYVKRYTNTPKTLDYMDVFSKGMERRKLSAPFYLKPLLAIEFKRLLKYENKIFNYFNNKTIISGQDKSFIPHPNKNEIVIIQNGVDTDFFKPLSQAKEYELLFNGNMNYPPNIESAHYLVNKIMPLVWGKMPAVRLLISGATPHASVLELQSDKVIVSGWVDDIRENFMKCKILVAPMQISIGLQNKLLEAMAMKLPCVTSPLANNALGAINGTQIMVAETPQQYAECVFMLLNDEKKAQQIADKAYQFVHANFNWESKSAILENLFSKNVPPLK